MKDLGIYSTETSKNSANRYEGLEAMRVISSFAVVFFHVCGAVQEIYGLAVFFVALQPWKKVPYDFWKQLVSYSYGIYILHFFWIHLLWFYTAHFELEISGASVICATLIIYSLSFLCAVLIRKLFPFDWLIPLIKTKRC